MTPDNTYVHILHESHYRKPLHGGLHDVKESRLKTKLSWMVSTGGTIITLWQSTKHINKLTEVKTKRDSTKFLHWAENVKNCYWLVEMEVQWLTDEYASKDDAILFTDGCVHSREIFLGTLSQRHREGYSWEEWSLQVLK